MAQFSEEFRRDLFNRSRLIADRALSLGDIVQNEMDIDMADLGHTIDECNVLMGLILDYKKCLSDEFNRGLQIDKT